MSTTAAAPKPTEVRSDLLVELDHAGCLACHAGHDALERYVTWFSIESHADPATLAGLRASLGFCPSHVRRLVSVPHADNVLGAPYRTVMRAARTFLDDGGTRALCPACAAVEGAERRALERLVDRLRDPAVGAAYAAGGGLCVPHLQAAFRFASATSARTLAEPLAGAAELRFGSDADASERAVCRARVPQPTRQSATTIERLLERLEHDACPTCQAAGRAERRYLTWFGHDAGHHADAMALSVDGFCPAHLHDISDPDLRGWVIQVQTRARQADLEKVPRTPERSARRWWQRRPPAEDGREALLAPRVCPACRAASTVERRETELLTIALRDTRVADHFRRSHGLCLRHAVATNDPIVREVAAVRLETIGWELEESLRKTGWDFRHEPDGPEADAWRRAPALLDGATYLGGPPGPLS